MKQRIFLIICLIVLNIGLISAFFAKDISERLNIKNRFKFIRVARMVGFVVSLSALVLIYFLNLYKIK